MSANSTDRPTVSAAAGYQVPEGSCSCGPYAPCPRHAAEHDGSAGGAGGPITVTAITCARCAGEGRYDVDLLGEATCRECRGHGVARYELTRDGLLGSLLPGRWRLDEVEHFARQIEHLDDAAAIAAIEREVAP